MRVQLAEIRKEYAALKPEEIRVIDPCQGSGHILCVLFDTLIKIYEDYGYTAREAAASIVKYNLWGLDIDDRASQLAYFSVMMKARQYDRRFFTRGIQPHVYAFEESNGITTAPLHDMGISLSQEEYGIAAKQAVRLIEEFHDAKEYGSILNISEADWDLLRRFAVPRWESEGGQIPLNIHGEVEAAPRLQALINLGQAMAQKYHVVVTNPPYMAISNASARLNDYAKKYYSRSKSDLFAVFIEKCYMLAKENSFIAMITQQSWMFLASFEDLREMIVRSNIVNMAHLGARAFEEIGGEVVQTTTFVLRNASCPRYISAYSRLLDYSSQRTKEDAFCQRNNLLYKDQSSFDIVPGSPIAYWVDESIYSAYRNPLLSSIAFSDGQILTGNNNKYLRLLWEVDATTVSPNSNWVLHAKGGEYRRWYGNIDTVVNWTPAAREHYRKDKIARFPKEEILFRRGITWTLVSMNPNFGVRDLNASLTFNKAAATILFSDESKIDYVIGFLNSRVAQELLKVINPTMNNNIKDILNMPYIYSSERANDVEKLVQRNITLSREDWDSFETSWDFKTHPLTKYGKGLIRDAYAEWEHECDRRFQEMKENETRLNEIFLAIYKMEGIYPAYVSDDTITVRKAALTREIRSLISYAVGCMFGRFSLDKGGIAYAGGTWNTSKYQTFMPDEDGILPICDDEYFEDDILDRFVQFVEILYGRETLEENLQFIANALGGKGSPREVIRNYFINDFYADHLRVYQKRPIYWLFDSGKKNGFKCLIYMHRYQPDTVARIRTDYVHEQQARYRTAIADLEIQLSSASTSERVKLTKRLQVLRDQAEEIRGYEEKIHHLADQMIRIDLDDGVKANYLRFKDVLSAI